MTPASAHPVPSANLHSPQQQQSQQPAAGSSVDELTRIFNTALISSRSRPSQDFTSELYGLMESPAFRTILTSIRQHARNHGMSDAEAATTIIETFRNVDRLWSEYIFQEGVDRLKHQLGGGAN